MGAGAPGAGRGDEARSQGVCAQRAICAVSAHTLRTTEWKGGEVPICAISLPRQIDLFGSVSPYEMASWARWDSELSRCSGGNGGNWMYSRIESGTADQSYVRVTFVWDGPSGSRS